MDFPHLVHAVSRHLALVLALLLLGAWPQAAYTEEGGSGHYFPGTISSFLDGVSSEEVFIMRLNGIQYDSSLSGSRSIPIAGQTALDVDVTSSVVALTTFWRPSWSRLGEHWSYAMTATIPFLRVEVEADVTVPGRPGTIRRKDTEYGLGDIVFAPMLNYHVSDDLNINGRLNIYAPTGDYQVGRLANLGKNYWTFEPAIGFMYLGQTNGREASISFGADFNTENTDTNYQTGTQLHVDGTLAQHFPIGKALLGIGVTGYWYRQVEGDSGSGATLGAFKARANGVGPSFTYSQAFGDHHVVAELKWVHELGVERRPEGDSIILKAMVTF